MSMVSFLSCECSDQAEASVGIMFPRHAGLVPGIHVFLWAVQSNDAACIGVKPGHDGN